MSATVRIATFNLENFDDQPHQRPSLSQRIALMRPQLLRANADILCLQEVNGQKGSENLYQLTALSKLLETTPYAAYHLVSTLAPDGAQVFDQRNLVILSRFPIVEFHQYKHTLVPTPSYRMITSQPPAKNPAEITWERPILHARIKVNNGKMLEVLNVHLKSRTPTDVPGQQKDPYTWKSSSGWAEGFFISSMKRVGQALEARAVIDKLFDEDAGAWIVVAGDFNSTSDEVPVEAIRADVENTGNVTLAERIMIPCENTIPESSRYSLLYQGKGTMIDHLLLSRSLLPYYRGTEIHNEVLHDESSAFATDVKYPESDHSPVIAIFELPSEHTFSSSREESV